MCLLTENMPKRTGSAHEEDTEDNKRQNTSASPKTGDNARDSTTKTDILKDLSDLKRSMELMKEEFRDSINSMTQKIGEVVITQNATTQATNFQADFLEEVNEKCADQQLRHTKIERKMEVMSQAITGNESNIQSARQEIRQVAQDVKDRNLILNGLPENTDEVAIDVGLKFLKNIDPTIKEDDIETAYRMGKKENKKGSTRILMVKFKFGERKQVVMRKKAALKSKKQLGKVYCNDDLPETTRRVIQDMRDIAAYATKIGYTDAKVSGCKLTVNGKTYYEHDLVTLPDNLKLENVKTRPIGEGIGFQSRHSYLSNFYPCHIRINGVFFTSSEQAYQYQKAVICERDDTALSIKSTNDPEKVKHLGDKLETCPEWELKKRATMKCVVAHKFKQNPTLRAKLQNTSGMKLLECTTNKYWGTGRRLDSLLWNESNKFEGRNELGLVLEEIRSALDRPALNRAAENRKVNPDLTKGERGVVSEIDAITDINLPSHPSAIGCAEAPLTLGNKENVNRQTAKEISSTITATVIPEAENGPKLENVDESRKQSTQRHESEYMDIEGVDSVSLSSVFSDSSDQIDTKNITLSDGRLDINKIASWKLHSLNTSRIASLSSRGTSESRRKYQEVIKSQNELGGDDPSTSTPKCGDISTVKNRKKRRSVNQGHVGGEKGKLNDLLKEMNLI